MKILKIFYEKYLNVDMYSLIKSVGLDDILIVVVNFEHMSILWKFILCGSIIDVFVFELNRMCLECVISAIYGLDSYFRLDISSGDE